MRIGKYSLETRIGAGGYGEVWRGWLEGEQGFRKPVAVKLLKDTSGEHATQFFNEARIGAALKHPNIVDVYEFVQVDGQYVLAMELIEGETLESVIARNPNGLPADQATDILRQVVSALNYAHALKDNQGQSQGLVHRDLKPGNIMLDSNGIIKVLDFGIAVFRTADRTTGPGVAKGTLCYMAPEQIEAENVTQAIDLWAVGAIAYELCTGKFLVPPGDVLQAVLQITELDESAVGRVVGARAPGLQALVEGCLKPLPAERWTAQTAHAALSSGARWTPGPSPDRRTPRAMPTNSDERSLRHKRDSGGKGGKPPTPKPAPRRQEAPKRSLAWWELALLPSGLMAGVLAIGAGIGLFGVAGSLAGWEVWSYDPDGPVAGGTLHVAWPRTRGVLDPYSRTTTVSSLVLPSVVERLIGLDRDGRPVPGPIAAWTESGNTLSLTLRPDVWFHPHPCLAPEGRLATPEDVRQSLRWAYDEGRLPGDVRSISVGDDGLINLKLAAPSPFVVRNLADVFLLPADLRRCEPSEDLRQPIGTGPFRFAGPVDGDTLELFRNPKYWRLDAVGRPLPYLDGVVASAVPDTSDALRELSGGSLHVFDAVNGTWLEQWLVAGPDAAAPPAAGVVVVPDSPRDRIGLKGLLFMRHRTTAVSAPLRAAIAEAIDRGAIASAPTAGEIAAGSRILPADALGHQPALVMHPLDPSAAGAAVAAAGGGPGAPLMLGAFESDSGEAEVVARTLEGIGIPCVVVPLSQASLESNMREPVVDVVLVEHYGTTWGADPYPLLADFTAALNEVSWVDPLILAELTTAAQTADRAAREKHYANIERGLLSEAAFIPIGFLKLGPTGGIAVRHEVRGLVDPTGERVWRSRDAPPFSQVWIGEPPTLSE